MRAPALALGLVAVLGCKSKRDLKTDDPMPEPPLATDAMPAARDAGVPWPELEGFPRTQPERVIALPAKATTPRFEVGGPVIAGEVAVVSSSQFGFLAADWRRGTIAWTKPAGMHVAPPVIVGDDVVLIGDCLNPPVIPDGELLLGCVRVVTAAGADQSYTAIRANPKAAEAFASAAGPQAVWADGDRAVRWRRGDAAVRVDLVTGAARPTEVAAPPLAVVYKEHSWDISQVDGRIVAREHGREAWSTKHPYTQLLGSVWLPDMSPMLRIATLGGYEGAEVRLLDIDATGSLYAQSARPTPGIGLLGWGVSEYGDAAIAVRIDVSLRRDFVVGYAANAALLWVYPLPEVPRADPVGVAIAPDAVVVFHDGDTLTILPELSTPPTAPGGGRGSSRIPTP